MKWKEIKPKSRGYEFSEGETITGVLKARIPNKFKQNDYIVNVQDANDKENGKDLIISGCTMLDDILKEIKDGTLLQIQYIGEKESRNKMTYKEFKVYLPDDTP